VKWTVGWLKYRQQVVFCGVFCEPCINDLLDNLRYEAQIGDRPRYEFKLFGSSVCFFSSGRTIAFLLLFYVFRFFFVLVSFTLLDSIWLFRLTYAVSFVGVNILPLAACYYTVFRYSQYYYLLYFFSDKFSFSGMKHCTCWHWWGQNTTDSFDQPGRVGIASFVVDRLRIFNISPLRSIISEGVVAVEARIRSIFVVKNCE